MKVDRRDIITILLSLFVCLLAGFIGSIAISDTSLIWFGLLNKSTLNPPNWAFAPAWGTLYILMGLALFLTIKKKNHKLFTIAIVLFVAQLILNVLWSYIFFANRSPQYALFEIIVLDIVVFAWLYISNKISRQISALIIPYAVWIIFASYLNFYVVNNNKFFGI